MPDKNAHIPIDLIDVLDQKHRLKTNVADLIASIQETGQINPLIVRKHGRRFVLKAGRRRLSALQSIQATTGKKQTAFVTIRKGTESEKTDEQTLHDELIKIDENIMRQDLSEIETDEALHRRKQVYEELHPTTKHGAAGAFSKHGGEAKRSFVKDAAEKLKVSKRTVEKAVARIGKTSDRVKRARADGTLSQSKVDMLTMLKPDEQDMLLPFIEKMDVAETKRTIAAANKRDAKAVWYELKDAAADVEETPRFKIISREALRLEDMLSEGLKARDVFRSKAKFQHLRDLEKLAKKILEFVDFQRAALGEVRGIRKVGGERKFLRARA